MARINIEQIIENLRKSGRSEEEIDDAVKMFTQTVQVFKGEGEKQHIMHIYVYCNNEVIDFNYNKICWKNTVSPKDAPYYTCCSEWDERELSFNEIDKILAELSRIEIEAIKNDPNACNEFEIPEGANCSSITCKYNNGEGFKYFTYRSVPKQFTEVFEVLRKYCRFKGLDVRGDLFRDY